VGYGPHLEGGESYRVGHRFSERIMKAFDPEVEPIFYRLDSLKHSKNIEGKTKQMERVLKIQQQHV
jgi:hypothetical protein